MTKRKKIIMASILVIVIIIIAIMIIHYEDNRPTYYIDKNINWKTPDEVISQYGKPKTQMTYKYYRKADLFMFNPPIYKVVHLKNDSDTALVQIFSWESFNYITLVWFYVDSDSHWKSFYNYSFDKRGKF